MIAVYEADYKSDFVPCPFHGIKRHMPFIMGTPDEPFLIIYCLALTKHIYKKIKSKYLNKPDLGAYKIHIKIHPFSGIYKYQFRGI